MSFAKVYSAQTTFLEPTEISVEVDVSNGLHNFSIVGLGDKAIEESKDRVCAAIKNSGFKSPKSRNQKVVISLAPADIRKEGSFFDVPIALAYLLSIGEIEFDPRLTLFIGELSLDGDIRGVKGIIPITRFAQARGYKQIFVPHVNAHEAALIDGITVFGAHTLIDILRHINTKKVKDPDVAERIAYLPLQPYAKTQFIQQEDALSTNFFDIQGQELAKRGLIIAAAGGHNIAFFGPPGTGKTLLARAFCSLLPPLTFEEMLETTSIHSVTGSGHHGLITSPPFRAPHHAASYTSLIGGGTYPRPGEVTLAHNGVLFMDEFPEFDRRTIDCLRQPLEDRVITVSRTKNGVTFPANFTLVAAMNPCPCGNFGIDTKICTCLPSSVSKYRQKISGPITDRIDMWVEVSMIPHSLLAPHTRNDTEVGRLLRELRTTIQHARDMQRTRHRHTGGRVRTNSMMSSKDIGECISLKPEVLRILNKAALELDISARSYHRIIKLSRTIADLAASEHIEVPHILEALQYRQKIFN